MELRLEIEEALATNDKTKLQLLTVRVLVFFLSFSTIHYSLQKQTNDAIAVESKTLSKALSGSVDDVAVARDAALRLRYWQRASDALENKDNVD